VSTDLVITEIDALYTMDDDSGVGEQRGAAVAIQDGLIRWVGPSNDAPTGTMTVSARGCAVLPGLIDCHTHAAWAGSRAVEWEQRLAGANYSEILEAGGGILSTVRTSREASLDTLTALTAARLTRMRSRGVTTAEVKSGYGLNPQDELKQLRAAHQAGKQADVDVLGTFLGAHTVPAEWRHDRKRYIQQVMVEQIPKVAQLARFIDVYVDRGAFTVDEGRAILEAGATFGLIPRIHAEQVTYTGAAAMAAQLGASSADHLEQIDAAGIAAMAASGTVAVLLPGAMLTLRDPSPPVAAFREAGVPMAIASDLNPGTSTVYDLWACATLACWQMQTTVAEALRGITVNAARALRLDDRGVVRVGLRADLVVVEPAPGEPVTAGGLVQHLGGNTIRHVIRGGRLS
jgi:imidazolonepropionase